MVWHLGCFRRCGRHVGNADDENVVKIELTSLQDVTLDQRLKLRNVSGRCASGGMAHACLSTSAQADRKHRKKPHLYLIAHRHAYSGTVQSIHMSFVRVSNSGRVALLTIIEYRTYTFVAQSHWLEIVHTLT
jgi:hypothetical protein